MDNRNLPVESLGKMARCLAVKELNNSDHNVY